MIKSFLQPIAGYMIKFNTEDFWGNVVTKSPYCRNADGLIYLDMYDYILW